MPLPQGYTLDQPVKLPSGYKLDSAPSNDAATSQKGFFESAADASGLSALSHPIDTIMGLPSAIKGMVSNTVDNVKQGVTDLKKEGLSEKARRDFGRAVPIVGPALAEAQAQHDAGNDAGMAGTLTGTVAGLVGPKALKEVAPMVPGLAGKAATATGEAMQDAGTGLVNKTVGTLKADFKRGANPARGYLSTGNGPALTMASLAEKADNAIEATGTKLSAAYKAADASGKIIPVKEVADAIAGPMREAYDVATGVGAPKGLLEDLKHHASTFTKVLEDGTENGGFTSSQVWKIKKDLAKATSWSDPTQVGLKSVTQQQVGALSGLLQEAVPETTALNQNFMDLLKLSGRAEERAKTGSRPLTAHIYKASATAMGALAGGMEGNALLGAAIGTALDSVPAKTTIATGLYRGGKLLSSLGERLTPADGSAVEGVAPNDLGGNGANYKPGNPQITPPSGSNPELSEPNTPSQRWMSAGIQKVLDHVEQDPSSGLTPKDVAEVAKSPKGKQLLLQASSAEPGTPIMEKIVNKISEASDAPMPADRAESNLHGPQRWKSLEGELARSKKEDIAAERQRVADATELKKEPRRIAKELFEQNRKELLSYYSQKYGKNFPEIESMMRNMIAQRPEAFPGMVEKWQREKVDSVPLPPKKRK